MDRIIDRIQKLLALSSSDEEHEAATAAKMVQDLLAKHNLTMRDLNKAQLEKETEIVDKSVINKSRMPGWYTELLVSLASAFDCKVIVGTGYRSTSLRLVGTERDTTVAQLMFEYLCEVIDRLAKKHAYGRGRTYVASFRRGMVSRLSDRVVTDAKKKRSEIDPETEEQVEGLILLKKDKLTRYMASLSTSGSYSSHLGGIGHASGYHSGKTAADSVNLSDQVKGGRAVGYLT